MRALLALAIAVSISAGCGEDEPKKNPVSPPGGGGPTSTAFTGFFGDLRGYSGPISITIATTSLAGPGPRMAGSSRAPATLIAATAEIDLGHATILSLSGWYDTADRSIALTGGPYTFYGAMDTLAGIPAFVADEDSNSWYAGAFVALLDSARTLPVYCGVGTPWLSKKLGVLGFARVDTTLIGVAHVNGRLEWFLLQGVLTGTGNARTAHLEASTPMSSLTMDGIFYLGTGTGGGTYSIFRESSGETEDGTWDAQPCN